MAFHALIGAGFLAATFLVRPFLPDDKEMDIDEICGRANQSDIPLEMGGNISPPNTEDLFIPTIAWPFIISGVWCIIFSVGFLILAKLPYKVSSVIETGN